MGDMKDMDMKNMDMKNMDMKDMDIEIEGGECLSGDADPN